MLFSELNEGLNSKLSEDTFKVSHGNIGNINDFNKCGIFSIYDGLNAPVPGQWCVILVVQQNGDNNFINQLCFVVGVARPYSRAYNGSSGSWTAWEKL